MDDGPSRGFSKRFRSFLRRLTNGSSSRFEEEIQDLIDQGAEQGVITPGEGEMIQSIFELGETVAREIMVPRTSIVAVPGDARVTKALEVFVHSGHSRVPVYENDIDRITGILHVKDLLPFWGHSGEETLPRDVIRPPSFVPETKKVVELLSEVRARKNHMVVVLDEYGGTAGLITLEDIIEEIVGDIHDEYDTEEEPIHPVDEHTFLVDARLNLEELEDYLGLEFPEGDYETLGGFITDLIGRVPQQDETVSHDGLTMTIRSADERKISQVEIRLEPAAAHSDDAA